MSDPFKNLKATLTDRYSCRGYLNKEVEKKDIEEAILAASRVPTWCNAQPWEVLVTRGEATCKFAEVLTKAASEEEMKPDFAWPEQYTGVYSERRRVCGYQLYEALGIDRQNYVKRKEQMMENFRFFGAPHVAIITTDADLGPYGSMDTGGFIAMLSVVLRSKGIASVVQASVTGYANVIRKHFNIPSHRLVQTAISFGYENSDHPTNSFRTDRATINDVMTIVGK